MVYCLQADLAFSTVARRDAVLADMQTQAAAHPKWGDVSIVATTWETGEAAISVDVRFVTVVSQVAIMNRIEQFATGQRTPLAGSWYQLHPCPHDQQPPEPCVPEPRRVW